MRAARASAVGLVLAVFGSLGSGCTGDLARPSEVRDLRVLAIRAEPPEVVLDGDVPPVALQALVADPRAPDSTIAWQWSACGLTDDLRCASDPRAISIGTGDGSLEAIAAGLVVTDELVADARVLDTFLGFGGVAIMTELVLAPGTDDELHAIKQLPAQYGLPRDTVENSNPSPPALLHDDVDWPVDEVLEVEPSAEVAVEPVSPPEDAEHYAVFRFDLGTEQLDENLDYSFFASEGTWSRNGSGGPPDIVATETTLASRWTAPSEPPADGAVTMWVVVRDGRGGTAWTERRVRVVP